MSKHKTQDSRNIHSGTQPQVIRIKRLADNLNYGISTVKRAIQAGNIPTTKVGKKEPAVEVKYINKIKELISQDPELSSKRNIQKERKAWRNRISENVTVDIRDRNSAPFQTILFVGPTNSGKTYHGLEELCADYEQHPDQVHVYCGPLRLLAYEVYQKLVARYGEENVGFITGEEAINPEAKLLACTVEMAPEEGYSILVDEAHWLAEPSRGHVWSKVLVGGKYKNFYVLTAGEAVPLIEKLTEDSHHLEVRQFTRKTPLNYKGKIKLSAIPPKTAVVCFSRKTVYILARELEKMGKKVGVLYGALPLKVRKQQIEDYLNGVYDVMVTTDVIGHGINLPIDNVVFTQTEKFDGSEIRELYIWEAAQIAGRAGRFGLSEEGKVYLAEGMSWFSNSTTLIKNAALAAEGKIQTDLYIEKASIAPRLIDLGIKDLDPNEALMSLLPAIKSWQQRANGLLLNRSLQPAELEPVIQNAEGILDVLNCPQTPWATGDKTLGWPSAILDEIKTVDIIELWQLISGPFDIRSGVIQRIALWLGFHDRNTSSYLAKIYKDRVSYIERVIKEGTELSGENIEAYEGIVAFIAEIKMGFVMFGREDHGELWLGTLPLSQILKDEETINQLIIKTLQKSIRTSSFGKCKKCNKPTKPWLGLCDSCFQNDKPKRWSHADAKAWL